MQTTLFGGAADPSFDASFSRAQRIALDERGAWVERVQGWVDGHETWGLTSAMWDR